MVGAGEVDEELQADVRSEGSRHGPVASCIVYEVINLNPLKISKNQSFLKKREIVL